ncbi:hypothetical protein N7457_008235 [Penicillium paradoxum]|uniref:uncharacterized protein n=1 Tax=Penicillium paradoxum TaxID=176176 RepID=UPI0025480B99|nr:uncharacterized protein N7457_008235 [Penicillium paradoxum]KAJ5773339.1 hypothetical protein N7457_008235 [Penicillium paradoxum]
MAGPARDNLSSVPDTKETDFQENNTQRADMHDAQPVSGSNDNQDGLDQVDGQIPVTQGSFLPGITATKIQKITELNRSTTSFDIWRGEVEFSLGTLCIEPVIDSTLPRPSEFDADYGRWRYWSRIVGSWLFNQVNEDLKLEIFSRPRIPREADEVYKVILDEAERFNTLANVYHELNKFDDITRENYTTAYEYITAYRKQFNVLKRFGVAPPPAFAIARLMRNIEDEVEKVMFIRERTGAFNAGDMTEDHFYKYITELAVSAKRQW